VYLMGRPFTVAATSAGTDVLQLFKIRTAKAIAAEAPARIVFIDEPSL